MPFSRIRRFFEPYPSRGELAPPSAIWRTPAKPTPLRIVSIEEARPNAPPVLCGGLCLRVAMEGINCRETTIEQAADENSVFVHGKTSEPLGATALHLVCAVDDCAAAYTVHEELKAGNVSIELNSTSFLSTGCVKE